MVEMTIASCFYSVCIILFGHFEEGTAVWRRLLKLAVFVGGTGLLVRFAGRWWWLGVYAAWLVLGLCVHVWWCRKHGIHPLSAEPRTKYRQLRGWKTG